MNFCISFLITNLFLKLFFPVHIPSPVKTPKRKATKKDMQWEVDDVETFIALCEGQKDTLMLHPGTIPTKTWKDLAESLESMKIQKTWQSCRDKFSQMYTFFKTVLPSEGKMGPNTWPYFSSFCTIMDIPPNYHALLHDHDLPEPDEDEEESEYLYTCTSNKYLKNDFQKIDIKIYFCLSDRRLWTSDRVKLLISLFKGKGKYFLSTKSVMRHDVLWAQISQEMVDFKHNISWKQCKNQFSSLKQRFNKEYDNQKKTGAAPSKWEYFDEMHAIFGGTASLDAPYLVSAGRGLTSHVKGNLVEDAQRKSRTRPQSHRSGSSSSTSNKSTNNKYSSKTEKYSAVHIQELKFEQTERMLDEVTKIRTNLEKNSAIRRLVYKELLGKKRHAELFPHEADDDDADWEELGDD